jgi:hypothetical protein
MTSDLQTDNDYEGNFFFREKCKPTKPTPVSDTRNIFNTISSTLPLFKTAAECKSSNSVF